MQKIPNDDVVFLHDRAPCMSTLETQKLITDKGIDFFGNSVWPGNSPNLNPTENLGAIVKQRVEENFLHFGRSPTLSFGELDSVKILQSLLRSMRSRLDADQTSGGGYTKCQNFWIFAIFSHFSIFYTPNHNICLPKTKKMTDSAKTLVL